MVCISHDVCFHSLGATFIIFYAPSLGGLKSFTAPNLIQSHRDGAEAHSSGTVIRFSCLLTCLPSQDRSLDFSRSVRVCGIGASISALILPPKDRDPPSSHFSSQLQSGSGVKHIGNLYLEPNFSPPKLSLSLGRS